MMWTRLDVRSQVEEEYKLALGVKRFEVMHMWCIVVRTRAPS
jgi:hypothetical protein